MNVHGEEQTPFEICVVYPKRFTKEENENSDCIEVLVKKLSNAGLVVERVIGVTDELIKLAAPLQTLGLAAAELQMKKPTYIGMDLPFEWEEVKAFVRQPDGWLFSWCERFECYHHLLYGIVNNGKTDISLTWDGKEFEWVIGESLLRKLEALNIVKQVFPLHDEIKRKQLLKSCLLNWKNFANQPIDDIYAYFGLKIAIYFAFLQMVTRWILFPAALGLVVHFVDFGSLQLLVLPVFFVSIILWAGFLSQFWKRKNAALVARWQVSSSVSSGQGCKLLGLEWNSITPQQGLIDNDLWTIKIKEKEAYQKFEWKEAYQKFEWFGHLMRFRNNTIIILSIVCLQLPFELAYAHLYQVLGNDIMKFGLTAVYLVLIQHFTKMGGKISVKLIKYENNENTEYQADSLVYKVFGLYFMQSYIGIFYHALLQRNFKTLRQVLIQRLIVYQVLDNLLENSLPYLKYSYKKYTVRSKKRQVNRTSTQNRFYTKAEKEYLKPQYAASIGDEIEDGLFDDFLELALQFGMIMMFACAFPLVFTFAAVNCFMEIRSDALKLLTMLRRPVPRSAVKIGGWLNIFQFLIVMSICTNSALLVWLYDEEGKWKIEPGLAAILIMEHILLLIKFGFARLVPDEPAWVRANQAKKARQAQHVCSRSILRSISGGEEAFEDIDLKKS